MPYLSLAIWVPIVAGCAVLAVGRDRDAATARWIALVGALVGFLVTIPLWTHFELGTSDMQFVERADRFEEFEENSAIMVPLKARLDEVNNALGRIEEGTYGTCSVCANPIEEDRLNANPAASTCIAHMES